METIVRVLYIDDNRFDRELVLDALQKEQEGFEVHLASNREEFEDLLMKLEIDVVLSDFNIAGFQGDQVLEIVEKNTPGVPVIIVTGTGSEEIAVDLFNRGAADYVIKSPQHILRLPFTIKTALEKKKAEEDILKWGHIFQNAGLGVSVTEPATYQLELINPAYAAMHGFTVEELRGTNALDLYPPHCKIDVATALEKADRNGNCTFESEHLHKNGSIFPVLINLTTVRDTKGNILYRTGNAMDITERRKVEEEKQQLQTKLLQKQKMEALGTLAGGIAHDFNNILSAIMGFTDMTMAGLPEDSPVRRNLEKVMSASNRAKEMVRQILAFSRKGEQKMEPVSMEKVVHEASRLLRSTIPTSIEIKTSIQPQLPPINGNETQINQVIINLCTNAAHAVGNRSGLVKIELEEVVVDQMVPPVKDLKRGVYQQLSVDDNGCGMTPELTERIFEPFFTTKSKDEGTGMGLSVVYGIVKSHGGGIHVYSEPGKGTRVSVYFPASKDGVTEEAEPEQTDVSWEPAVGNERILFVEDDPLLAELGAEMLTMHGYRVEYKTDSREALELFQRNNRHYDLVITDMSMPGMTGTDLTAEIHKINPHMPVILCTGFSGIVNQSNYKEFGIRALVMKPIISKELSAAVRMVLEDPKSEIQPNILP